jgi:hypothetical protein
MTDDYEFEDLRKFFVRRPFFREGSVLPAGDYDALKRRELTLPTARAAYLRAFCDGYLCARNKWI